MAVVSRLTWDGWKCCSLPKMTGVLSPAGTAVCLSDISFWERHACQTCVYGAEHTYANIDEINIKCMSAHLVWHVLLPQVQI